HALRRGPGARVHQSRSNAGGPMRIRTTQFLAVAALAAASITGCDRTAPSGSTASKPSTPAAMPAAKPADQRVEHVAEGKLNSVDQATGRVSITHSPAASANWPGMTMSFKLADPSAAA